MTGRMLAATALLILACTAATGQNAEDLIEKGLYAEESLGDLQQAARYYKEAQSQEAARPVRARAMYRMGAVYVKLGQPEVGVAILRQMIRDYPEEKKLISLARKQMGEKTAAITLGPVIWPDQEVLTYVERLGSKTAVMTLAIADRDQHWEIVGDRHGGLYPSRTFTVLEKEAFRPVRGTFKSREFADLDTFFEGDRMRLETDKGVRHLNPNRRVYLESQLFYLVRRLPLEPGATFSLPLFSEAMSMIFDLDLTVADRETVEVPAGVFPCFKITSSLQFTLWVSDTPERYLVKGLMMNMGTELAEVVERDFNRSHLIKFPKGPGLKDAELRLPPRWFSYCLSKTPEETIYHLMPPEYDTTVLLTVETGHEVGAKEGVTTRMEPDEKDGYLQYHIEVEQPGLRARFRFTAPEERLQSNQKIFDALAADFHMGGPM